MTTLTAKRAKALLNELTTNGAEGRIRKRLQNFLRTGTKLDRELAESAIDDLNPDRRRELEGYAPGLKRRVP